MIIIGYAKKASLNLGIKRIFIFHFSVSVKIKTRMLAINVSIPNL